MGPLLRRMNSGGSVDAQLVKKLRDSSGAPMMDCKKALGACGGDMGKAMDWLRAKGIARAAAASDRVATEGLVGILSDSRGITLVEVNSETDFVGKNADFHNFVGLVARSAADFSSSASGEAFAKDGKHVVIAPEALLAHNGGAVQNALGLAVATIRENIVIKRIAALQPGSGSYLASYVHGKIGGVEGAGSNLSLGKTVSVVCLNAPEAKTSVRPQLEELGRKVAMHVVAANPKYCLESEVDSTFLQRERDIIKEQMAGDTKNASKKADVLEKVREGKLKKRLSEVCLESQPCVVEEGFPVVSKYLQDAGKVIGAGNIKVTAFRRWGLGETHTPTAQQ